MTNNEKDDELQFSRSTDGLLATKGYGTILRWRALKKMLYAHFFSLIFGVPVGNYTSVIANKPNFLVRGLCGWHGLGFLRALHWRYPTYSYSILCIFIRYEHTMSKTSSSCLVASVLVRTRLLSLAILEARTSRWWIIFILLRHVEFLRARTVPSQKPNILQTAASSCMVA